MSNQTWHSDQKTTQIGNKVGFFKQGGKNDIQK